jgi:hypothetical protein
MNNTATPEFRANIFLGPKSPGSRLKPLGGFAEIKIRLVRYRERSDPMRHSTRLW